MTALTPLFVLVILIGLVNRRGFGIALAITAATPVGAALVLGGEALPTFFGAALVANGLLALRYLYPGRSGGFRQRPVPGLRALGLLVVWNVLVVLISPYLFNGTVTLPAPGGSFGQTEAGVVLIQNVAQALYLFLGAGVVLFLARSKWAGPEIVGIVVGGAMVLSFWAYLGLNAGVPFPTGFFDNSPGFVLISTEVGGAARFRGIFSEPAGLASACLIAVAYTAARVRHVRGLRRLGVVVVGAMALFMASISTSTTFLVAGVALLLIAGGAAFVRIVLRRGPLSALSVTSLCAVALAGTYVLPILAGIVDDAVSDKVSSSSFEERSGADALSFQIVLRTFGLGVGLGSHRPSSFLPAMLSTIGVVGTGLLAYAIATLVRRSLPHLECRPVVWALIALLTTKMVSGPDLNDTNGLLFLGLGILANAVARNESTRTAVAGSVNPPPHGPHGPPALPGPPGPNVSGASR